MKSFSSQTLSHSLILGNNKMLKKSREREKEKDKREG